MSHKLGDPISDDSADENSQIRGLEEDKGIYHNPEVFASPRDEEDDILRSSNEGKDDGNLGKTLEDRMQDEESEGNQEGRGEFQSNSHPAEYPAGPPPAYEETSLQQKAPPTAASTESNRIKTPTSLTGMLLGNIARPFEKMAMGSKGGNHSDEEDDDDEYDDMDIPVNVKKKSKYNNGKYQFTDEEIELLEMMDEYQAEEIGIEPALKPFLLEFQPAVGDVDSFIKVPRPDEVEDNIGLTQLDEPAIKQSDPTILDMQLRHTTKEFSSNQDTPVKRVHRADRNVELIEKWIDDIKDLRRSKPAASVHYTKPLPDVEKLMQEWPADFEKGLPGIQLPTAELDVDLPTFADLCLNLVDIPVHKSRIQSLHLLFSLYSEFKNSQHFRNLAQNAEPMAFKENTDRLEL
ncbi:unnamed protein product, partial [Mesorhabditis belari]|uniref:Intraflagellar transport protein 46 homolog n=1 Tax=Mesorhabditis belari TaxID=2138241 RepID=A0AAF3FML2_9BILA